MKTLIKSLLIGLLLLALEFPNYVMARAVIVYGFGATPYYQTYPGYYPSSYSSDLVWVPPTWNGSYWIAGHYEPAAIYYPHSYPYYYDNEYSSWYGY